MCLVLTYLMSLPSRKQSQVSCQALRTKLNHSIQMSQILELHKGPLFQ